MFMHYMHTPSQKHEPTHTHTHTHTRSHHDFESRVCIHPSENRGASSPPNLHSKFSQIKRESGQGVSRRSRSKVPDEPKCKCASCAVGEHGIAFFPRPCLPQEVLALLCCCTALDRHPAPSPRRCCAAQRVRLRGLSPRPIPAGVGNLPRHT